MRIITGSAKGTKLYAPEGDTTRPTSERAKEALFSMIQFDLVGRRVLDLFAGSGQLGLEAISRGASYCLFADASDAAIAVVRKNIEKTRFSAQTKTIVTDYRNLIRKSAGREGFDIVFLDPPYASDALTDALLRLARSPLLKRGCLLVCESENEDLRIFEKEPRLSEWYTAVRTNHYGRVHIELLTPKEAYYAQGEKKDETRTCRYGR